MLLLRRLGCWQELLFLQSLVTLCIFVGAVSGAPSSSDRKITPLWIRHLQEQEADASASTSENEEGQEATGCPSCSCPAMNTTTDDDSSRIKLRFLNFEPGGDWLEPIAEEFRKKTNGAVEVELVYISVGASADEVINEAKSQLGFYDGFFTFPSLAGEVFEYQGWHDLTPYVFDGRLEQFEDIMLGYRKHTSQYEGRILMFPLDGDLFSMFYRKDVLEHFNLTVPRTWDEYIQVARRTHGEVFENRTLNGSCLGRGPYCTSAYYVFNMLATMTQSLGFWQGFLFNTANMEPLLGAALEQALLWSEQQVVLGSPNEFPNCIEENKNEMNAGTCTLTINWGNSFKGYRDKGDFLVGGRFGVAPTPGSTMVLDRETGDLVPCTPTRCKYAKKYDDLGYVNAPPYLAFGGFACAVNNYTDDRAKKAATEFCAFTSSTSQSIKGTIPPATGNNTENGQDPFRLSHLDVDRYVEQGYERELAENFTRTVRESIESENVVIDDKFPIATSLLFTADYLIREYLYEYLNATKRGDVSEEEQAVKRNNFVESLTQTFVTSIKEYDALPTTSVSTLEAYQRLRGVYDPGVDLNQIGDIRVYGYVLFGLTVAASLLFAIWTIARRNDRVVKASQPIFLVMICVGALILGSAIIPLGIDDSDWSDETAGRACMATIWLLALGFTTCFAALYSKVRRLNLVYKNASRFRRVQVTPADVLLPFTVLLLANTALLLILTIVAPLEWKRIWTSDVSSYGTCNSSNDTATKPLICIIASLNVLALILANVEAFKSRRLGTEYGESSFIAIAMLGILQIVAVGVPLLFLVDENPAANYYMQSTMVFTVAISLLLLIFVPKVWAWVEALRTPDEESRRRGSQFGLMMEVYEARAASVTALSSRGDAKVVEVLDKVEQLQELLEEEGIDAGPLFDKVGLASKSSSMGDQSGRAATPFPS